MDKILGTILVVVVVFFIVGLILSFPIMWLWNGCLVPAVAGVSEISALQAFGLYVLFGLLFKNTSVETKK